MIYYVFFGFYIFQMYYKKYESKTDKDVNKMCINIIRYPAVFFSKSIKSNVLRTLVLRKQCVMYYELNRTIEKCH